VRVINNSYCHFLLTAFLVTQGNAAYAYEVETHAFLTGEAYQQSALVSDSSLLSILGIEKDKDYLGVAYFDMIVDPNTAETKQRGISDYTNDIILGDLQYVGQNNSIKGWLMRGAIREDDLKAENPPCVKVKNPTDDDYPNPVNRPFNHFYDPVSTDPITKGALTGLGIPSGTLNSPDWGAGTSDAFAALPVADAGRRNHFSVLDAREAMYRALTGRATSDSVDIRPSGYLGTDEFLRRSYWATTFKALGNVVHLIEDMGQPQHTRNERHGGVCINAITGDPSVYEKYINARMALS